MDLRGVLTGIYREKGELTPQLVVNEARPDDHPLHHRFEWNDAVAGEAYRRVQAAELIRSVKVVYTQTPQGEKKSLRAFESLHRTDSPDKRGYAPVEELVKDDIAYRILLRNCERDIAALREKYGHLSEFADLLRKAAS